jgi:hypothetical protein
VAWRSIDLEGRATECLPHFPNLVRPRRAASHPVSTATLPNSNRTMSEPSDRRPPPIPLPSVTPHPPPPTTPLPPVAPPSHPRPTSPPAPPTTPETPAPFPATGDHALERSPTGWLVSVRQETKSIVVHWMDLLAQVLEVFAFCKATHHKDARELQLGGVVLWKQWLTLYHRSVADPQVLEQCLIFSFQFETQRRRMIAPHASSNRVKTQMAGFRLAADEIRYRTMMLRTIIQEALVSGVYLDIPLPRKIEFDLYAFLAQTFPALGKSPTHL